MTDEEEFRENVMKDLNTLKGMFTSLFGNHETNDKGQIHWIKEKIEDHDLRLKSMEQIKIFGKGVTWAFGLMFSAFAIGAWELIKQIWEHFTR